MYINSYNSVQKSRRIATDAIDLNCLQPDGSTMSTPPTKKLRLTAEHVTKGSQPASVCYFTDFSISSRTRGRRPMPSITCSSSPSPQHKLPLNPNVDSLRLCPDIDDANGGSNGVAGPIDCSSSGGNGVNVDQTTRLASTIEADLGLHHDRRSIRSAEVVKARYIRTLQQYQSVSSLIDALTAQQLKLDERRQKLFNVLETLSKMYKLIKRRSSAVSVGVASSPNPPAAYRAVRVDGRSSGPAAEIAVVGATAADAQVSSSTCAAGLEVVYELEEEPERGDEPEDLSVRSRLRRDDEWTAVSDEGDCCGGVGRDYNCTTADDSVAASDYYGDMGDDRETSLACYSTIPTHCGPLMTTDIAGNYYSSSPDAYLLPQPAHVKKADVNAYQYLLT